MPVVEIMVMRGFCGGLRALSAATIVDAASLQMVICFTIAVKPASSRLIPGTKILAKASSRRVCSGSLDGCSPMPDTIMLAIWSLGLSALCTALTSRTSPWVTLRCVKMVDSATPLKSRSSLSFDGVRATVKGH